MNPARPVRAFGVEEPMTGTTRSSEGLDIRRRKLLFRSWHRGMREMDLIEVPDRAILAWVTGEEAVPAEHDTPLFRRLRDFHLSRDRSR
jgi:antitoxin CptB